MRRGSLNGKFTKVELIAQYILGAAVLCTILLVNFGVITRLLLIPASWTDEMLQFFIVWLVFIMSAIALKVDGLISLEVVEDMLKRKPLAYKILKLIQAVLITIFVFFMLTQTYSLVTSQYFTQEVSPVLGFPLWVKNLGYFLGCVLFCIFAVWGLIDRIRAFKTKTE